MVIAENVPKIEAEEEIIETTSAVMPPPPPGVKAPRRRSLRKSNNLQSPCSSPGASNSCSSIKVRYLNRIQSPVAIEILTLCHPCYHLHAITFQ